MAKHSMKLGTKTFGFCY